MIRHLIETQVFGKTPHLEKIPYWIANLIGFDRVENWLDQTWSWGERNAYWSHNNRPWSRWEYNKMLKRLDAIDFFF